jgi:hypothetical protein
VTLQSTLGVTGVATFSAAPIYSSLTASSAVATDASKGLVSVTNTGTGNNVLATSPTITTPIISGDATVSGLTVGKGGGAVASNTAVGASALAATATGTENTGIGANALAALTTGSYNTAVGRIAMQSNTTGSQNTAVGRQALSTNISGSNNTAIGYTALLSNTADNNTAVGYQAAYSGTTGAANTAIGYQAGYSGTTAEQAVYVGFQAGYATTTSVNNVAVGYQSLKANTTGQTNTAIGHSALTANTTANGNTAVGYQAGSAITTGAKNVIIGSYTGSAAPISATGSNYIVLSDGDGNVRQHFRNDGVLFIPSVYATTNAAAANVYVGSDGFIGRSTSSLKYKKDVQNATHGLADVLKLRSVTFKSKSESNGDTVFGGFIAEEVDALGLTEFVQYADDGSPDALAYGNMVALLAKAIQELKAEFDAYKATHP